MAEVQPIYGTYDHPSTFFIINIGMKISPMFNLFSKNMCTFFFVAPIKKKLFVCLRIQYDTALLKRIIYSIWGENDHNKLFWSLEIFILK